MLFLRSPPSRSLGDNSIGAASIRSQEICCGAIDVFGWLTTGTYDTEDERNPTRAYERTRSDQKVGIRSSFSSSPAGSSAGCLTNHHRPTTCSIISASISAAQAWKQGRCYQSSPLACSATKQPVIRLDDYKSLVVALFPSLPQRRPYLSAVSNL